VIARQTVHLGKLAEAQEAADAAMEAATLAAEKLAALTTQGDRATALNTRLRLSSIASIEARAREDGVSLKLVMCRALEAYGIKMAPADLGGGTPQDGRMTIRARMDAA
jgi:hypothetical protein